MVSLEQGVSGVNTVVGVGKQTMWNADSDAGELLCCPAPCTCHKLLDDALAPESTFQTSKGKEECFLSECVASVYPSATQGGLESYFEDALQFQILVSGVYYGVKKPDHMWVTTCHMDF